MCFCALQTCGVGFWDPTVPRSFADARSSLKSCTERSWMGPHTYRNCLSLKTIHQNCTSCRTHRRISGDSSIRVRYSCMLNTAQMASSTPMQRHMLGIALSYSTPKAIRCCWQFLDWYNTSTNQMDILILLFADTLALHLKGLISSHSIPIFWCGHGLCRGWMHWRKSRSLGSFVTLCSIAYLTLMLSSWHWVRWVVFHYLL